MRKKIVFLTGTRADFGKLKPLITEVNLSKKYVPHIFATGMHMLEKYGSTVHEIFRQGFSNVYMYNNSSYAQAMDIALSNTINGFSNYVRELKPDMIIVHGDRAEALAGAIVGSFNNILVGHIEGGEISGTIDELIRHSITKLAHVHFISNDEAQKRLLLMGETLERIFKIGSPEIDIMLGENLPKIEDVKQYYQIPYDDYGILIYHPVTTELINLQNNIKNVVSAVMKSKLNYIVIQPNNDTNAEIIFNEYSRFKKIKRIRVFPSIRFEYFMTLLKHSNFILGNSSSGVREAPVFGVPSINIGTRESGRNLNESIFNLTEDKKKILLKINEINKKKLKFPIHCKFGEGNSAKRFMGILDGKKLWKLPLQKKFHEYNLNKDN
ncbi:MAG: hypothetical protein ACD_79C00287G0010 [uncultured bacterium]|nr:MAG: hypothetical protein ACD_79C00287G0010 [uncultured bacterium]